MVSELLVSYSAIYYLKTVIIKRLLTFKVA